MLILTRMVTDEYYNTIFEILDTDDYTILPVDDAQLQKLAKTKNCPKAIQFPTEKDFPFYSLDTEGYFRRDTHIQFIYYLNVFFWGDWCAVSYTSETLFFYRHKYIGKSNDSITCIYPLSLYRFICSTHGSLIQIDYQPAVNKLNIKIDLFNAKALLSTIYYQGAMSNNAQLEESFPRILKRDKSGASKLLLENHTFLAQDVAVYKNRETGNRFIGVFDDWLKNRLENVIRFTDGGKMVDKFVASRPLDVNNTYLKPSDIEDKSVQLRLPVISNTIKFKISEIYKKLIYSVYITNDEILSNDYEISIFWYILNNIFIKERQYLIDSLRVVDCKFYPQRIANYPQIDLGLKLLCGDYSLNNWIYGYMKLSEIGVQEAYNVILSKSRR